MLMLSRHISINPAEFNEGDLIEVGFSVLAASFKRRNGVVFRQLLKLRSVTLLDTEFSKASISSVITVHGRCTYCLGLGRFHSPSSKST
jgi:hypothetical protein